MHPGTDTGSPSSPLGHVDLRYRSRLLEPAVFLLGMTLLIAVTPYLYAFYYPSSAPPAAWIPALFAPFILLEAAAILVAARPRAYIAGESGVRLLIRERPLMEYAWSEVRGIRWGRVYARQMGTPRVSKLRPCPYLLIDATDGRGIIVGTWRFTISRRSVAEASKVTAGLAADHGVPVIEKNYDPPSGRRRVKSPRVA